MKIKVKKRNLDAALQVVLLAVGSGEDDTIATHYLIRHNLSTGATSVLAQDGRRLLAEAPLLECVVETEATGEFDAFTVPGWRMRTWLSAIENGDEEVTLTTADGSVKASAKRGTGKFGSLNPKDFPYWDAALSEAKVVATIAAARLTNILSYVKAFVSDQETRSPGLVAVESRDHLIRASDSVGVATVTSPALSASTLRMHGKDIPSILSFLAIKGEGDVEVLEHDRCLFLRRGDGSLIGASRWVHQFPTMKGADPDPSRVSDGSFRIKTADLLAAIKYLLAFAKKGEETLAFRFRDGKLALSMRSASGSADEDEQLIDVMESTNMDTVATTGFKLTKRYLESLANLFGEESLCFRVDVTPKNGYVSSYHERDGDNYYTIILWNKA